MAGVSATKMVELFGGARSTVLKVMTAFEKKGKTSSLKQNSGRKRKVSDRDCWILMWSFRKDHKNTALKTTPELNEHLENPIYSKTVKRQLHKVRFHWRATIRKSLNLF